MKNYVLLLAAALLLSCNKDKISPDNELIGTWKLIEVLADPGDGSGTFYPVNSEKTITFKTTGEITSNGSLCDMSTDANKSTKGTFSPENYTFRSDDCNNPEYVFNFLIEDNHLIIIYPCIEGCRTKYSKVN